MFRINGWASPERAPGSSPLPLPASDVKARLNFSSVRSPLSLRRSSYGGSGTVSSPLSLTHNYHMSRQNPAVLDQLYSLPSSPQKDHLYKRASPVFSHGGPGRGGSPMSGWTSHRNLQTSLVKQTLSNSHRKSLSLARPSLVRLATQEGHRSLSPVTVRLSGPDSVSLLNGHPSDVPEEGPVTNPCSKDVIISALKQKSRKRWASALDEDLPPQAKKTRVANCPPFSLASSSLPQERKRPMEASTATEAVKKTKISDSPCKKLANSFGSRALQQRSRVSIPEIIYEPEDETDADSSRGNTAEEESSGDTKSVASKRSSTPIAAEEEEEEEMRVKREASLKLQKTLSTVFPPSISQKDSSRRKLPVLCSTGARPHLLSSSSSSSSSSRSATQEDLKKDREEAAAKIKHFLTQEEEGESKVKSKKTDSTSTSIALPSSPSLLLTSTGSLPNITLSTLRSSPSHMNTPSSSTSISTAAVTSVLQLGLALSQTTSSPTTSPLTALAKLPPLPPLSSSSSSSSSSSLITTTTTSLAASSQASGPPLSGGFKLQPLTQGVSQGLAPPTMTSGGLTIFGSSSTSVSGTAPVATVSLPSLQPSSAAPSFTAALSSLSSSSAPSGTQQNPPLTIKQAGGLFAGKQFSLSTTTASSSASSQDTPVGLTPQTSQLTSQASQLAPQTSQPLLLSRAGGVFSSTATASAASTTTTFSFNLTNNLSTSQTQGASQLSAAAGKIIFSVPSTSAPPPLTSTGGVGLSQSTASTVFGSGQAPASGLGGGLSLSFSAPSSNSGGGLALKTPFGSGLSFNTSSASSEAPKSTLSFGNLLNSGNGLSFNTPTNPSGGLNFSVGSSTASTNPGGGLSFSTASTNPGGGLSFNTASTNPGGGLSFSTANSSSGGGLANFSAGNPSGGLNFSMGSSGQSSVGQQSQQGLFGTSGKLGTTGGQFGAAGGLFGATGGQLGATGGQLGATGGQLGATGGQLGATGGQLGATGGQLGAGGKPLFGSGSTSSGSLGFGVSGQHSGQQALTGFPPQQQQQQKEVFNFSGNTGQGASAASSTFKFGASNNSQGFNFAMGGTQNGASGGLSFGSNMTPVSQAGQSGSALGGLARKPSLSFGQSLPADPSGGGFNFTAGVGSSLQQPSNIFNTPSKQQQPSFQTPQMPQQSGFNFTMGQTPSNSPFNFGGAVNFSGTPGKAPDSNPRPLARPRRRGKRR